MLDVDQIIEDQAAMDRVSQQMATISKRWGVHIEFVRIQKVEAGTLTHVLAKKKDADLRNKEVIISAKAQKQTRVIESEGNRDRMIREAEGEAQQILSRGAPPVAATPPPPTHTLRHPGCSVTPCAAVWVGWGGTVRDGCLTPRLVLCLCVLVPVSSPR